MCFITTVSDCLSPNHQSQTSKSGAPKALVSGRVAICEAESVGGERPVCTSVVVFAGFQHGARLRCTEGAGVGPSRDMRGGIGWRRACRLVLGRLFRSLLTRGATGEQRRRCPRAKSRYARRNTAEGARRLVLDRLFGWLSTRHATEEQTTCCLGLFRPVFSRVRRQKSTRSKMSKSVGPRSSFFAGFYHGARQGNNGRAVVGPSRDMRGGIRRRERVGWSSIVFLAGFQQGTRQRNKRRAASAFFAPSFRRRPKSTRSEASVSVGPRSSFSLAFNTARDRGTTEVLMSSR